MNMHTRQLRQCYKWYICLFLLVTVFFLQSCAAAGSNVKVTAAPQVPKEVVDDAEKSVALTRKYFLEKYNVELKRPVQIFIVLGVDEYRAALIEKHGHHPMEADIRSKHSAASSNSNIILINADALKMPRSRYHIPAHELTHQYQHQLIGKPVITDMEWMYEGFANVVGSYVAEMAGKSQLIADRRMPLVILKSKLRRPKISQLSSRADWNHSLQDYGSDAIYATAEAAVIYLVGLYGEEAIIKYFRAVQSQDNAMAFNSIFGMTESQFEDKFEAYLMDEFKKIRLIPK